MRVSVAATILALAATAHATPGATLAGTVEERGTRRPVALASIAVIVENAPLGTPAVAEGETDEAGHFADVPVDAEARFTVAISAPGWKAQTFTETLAPSTRLEVTYRLDPDRYRRYESVVRGQATREEVQRLVVGGPEITEIAGTHGDALRAVTNLPGVARAPADSGL